MSDSWFSKLEKVIVYMTNNDGKKPPKKEQEIGSWLSDQLKFYRAGSGTAGMWVSEVAGAKIKHLIKNFLF